MSEPVLRRSFLEIHAETLVDFLRNPDLFSVKSIPASSKVIGCEVINCHTIRILLEGPDLCGVEDWKAKTLLTVNSWPIPPVVR